MKNGVALLLNLLVFLHSSGQESTGIGIGTTNAHPSAAFEVADSSRGILIPRMTMAKRMLIQSPAEGLMVYQIDSTKGFWFWNNTKWEHLSSELRNNPQSVLTASNTGYKFLSCQSYSGVMPNNTFLMSVNFDSVSAVYVKGGGAASLNMFFLDTLNNLANLFYEYTDSREWFRCFSGPRFDVDNGFGESSEVTLGRGFEPNSCDAKKSFLFKFFKVRGGANIVNLYYNNPGCSFSVCLVK